MEIINPCLRLPKIKKGTPRKKPMLACPEGKLLSVIAPKLGAYTGLNFL
jgi:hypothetical protein